ncbi:MAG: arsenate reductase family protein [Verrucomicrobiaceae bacterium]|nr:MAG: arsenate reductase family protein [Verrucomicrobiaceae bacterium]
MPTVPPVRVYLYQNCSTCRDASRWLDGQGIEREEIPIREKPPGVPELRRMLEIKGDLKKLFNTSGMDYRAQGLKDRLPGLTEDEALALLAANGNLVKRPFLLTQTGGAVGFKPEEWRSLFGK